MSVGGGILVVILILLFLSYFYYTNPWRDARAALPVMAGGAYLLRKYMKNKKKHNKKHK